VKRRNQIKKKFIICFIFLFLLITNFHSIQNTFPLKQNKTSKYPEKEPFISEFDNNSLTLNWARLWGEGGTYKDPLDNTHSHYGHDIAIDSQENIFFVGNTALGNGKSDFCLVKYDQQGKELWNQTWGGSRYDYAMGVAVDSNDNVYIAGTYHKYYWDQPEGGDMALIKYNSSGSKIWERTYGGSNDDECNGIAIDSNDNIYIAGTRGFALNDDFLVVKYDNTGSVQWSRTFGGEFPDFCDDIAIDSSDNIYLSGATNSFGAGFNYLLVKYNRYGTNLWYRVWDKDLFSDDFGCEVTIDSSNNVYIVGFTDNYSSPEEVTLVKYTNSGVFEWVRSWVGGRYIKDEYSDRGAITTGLDDNIYITSSEKILRVYNSSGGLQGTLNYYDSDMGTPCAMEFDSYGNLYIGGKNYTSHFYAKLSLVKYAIKTPLIDVLTPIPNALYGKISPEFELSIYEPNLNTTWYNLNGGMNFTFSSFSSGIDQTAWDACGNGTVSIKFYVNNSDGDMSYKEVKVRKDSIDPEISIISPQYNELVGNSAPEFQISLDEPHLDTRWYSLNNGENYTFFNSSGFIDQDVWDTCGNGTVNIRFFANDTVGNIGYNEVLIRKYSHIPEITIIEPTPFTLFSNSPPIFNLSIIEPDLNISWYTLNGGQEYFFSGTTGIINQSLWDLCGNGSVTIRFFTKNTAGNLAFEEVIVNKDIISPEIIIISPNSNELFGNETLGFDLLINEPHLNKTWYSLNDGINCTFSGSFGLISQEFWDQCGNGTVTIRFYANDTLGHLSVQEITVRKDNIAPIWDILPQDQILEYGEDFNYQLDAIDPSGIISWWINNTSQFSISSNGLIINKVMLTVNRYYLEVKVYDSVGNYCNASIIITVQDTTAPTWNITPINQNLEFGNNLNYDLDASDLSGIDKWLINDTIAFNISQNGLIFNIIDLSVGIYWIEVRAYDPYNQFCQTQLMINVSDTFNPSWDEIPTDQYFRETEDIYYDINATDLSGIDYWWISDTLYFYIDDQGLITNQVTLSVGTYWLEIRAYDPYGNYCSATIKITISEKISSPSIFSYNIFTFLGLFCIITIVLVKKNRRRIIK